MRSRAFMGSRDWAGLESAIGGKTGQNSPGGNGEFLGISQETGSGELAANVGVSVAPCKPARTGVRFLDYWSLAGRLMNSVTTHDASDIRRRIAELGHGLLRFSWTAVRVPLLALLVAMEPIVCWILGAVAVLGIMVSLLFEFVVRLPNYPFWLMMGISAGIAALQIPYYLLIRLFSAR